MSSIKGLCNLLADTDQPGLPELRQFLGSLLIGDTARGELIEVEKLLRSRVYRVRLKVDGAERSVVIKRLSLQQSYRERRVLQRWLPMIDLDGFGPPLLGSVAEQSGSCVWHVYEDLGKFTLDKNISDNESVRAATLLIGQLHARAALNPGLAECRASGGEFGSGFYISSVRDAIRSLQAIRTSPAGIITEPPGLIDRLLQRLESLWEQRSQRAEVLQSIGGPETMLHGDLWLTNIFVLPSRPGASVRLIDWDHVGVGPPIYDLSTYLLRFPRDSRPKVLDWYLESAEPMGWQAPAPEYFNALCDTAECSRLANAIIWAALYVSEENNATWAFDELIEIDDWFDTLQPVLPDGSQDTAVASVKPGAV